MALIENAKGRRENQVDELFCSNCAKIKIKDVPRKDLENYWMKV